MSYMPGPLVPPELRPLARMLGSDVVSVSVSLVFHVSIPGRTISVEGGDHFRVAALARRFTPDEPPRATIGRIRAELYRLAADQIAAEPHRQEDTDDGF